MNYGLFSLINGIAGHIHWLDSLMVFIADKSPFVILLVLLSLWFLGNSESERTVLYSIVTFVLAMIVALVFSHLYPHSRPFIEHHVNQLVSHSADNSFPSDHATGSFAIAFALFARNKKWGKFMIVFASLVAVSRVYVGVHYPSDVIAGLGIALISSYLVEKTERFIEPLIQITISLYQRYAILLIMKLKNRNKRDFAN